MASASRRERQPYSVPVFSLYRTDEVPIRTLKVMGFDAFDAMLRACDDIDSPMEYVDEDSCKRL